MPVDELAKLAGDLALFGVASVELADSRLQERDIARRKLVALRLVELVDDLFQIVRVVVLIDATKLCDQSCHIDDGFAHDSSRLSVGGNAIIRYWGLECNLLMR